MILSSVWVVVLERGLVQRPPCYSFETILYPRMIRRENLKKAKQGIRARNQSLSGAGCIIQDKGVLIALKARNLLYATALVSRCYPLNSESLQDVLANDLS